MRKFTLLFLITIIFISCSKQGVKHDKFTIVNKISIFEIYFPNTKQVENFSLFLRDTLKLPVEWEPFDFFGDSVVYDAAFYLGNTTLELLALYTHDANMGKKAKYNRILFQSNDIKSSSKYLDSVGLLHNPPFEFNITSNNSQLTIGKQINLDSLSKLSNINVAFWQYLPSAYNFVERGVSGQSLSELETKLDSTFELNPLGLKGLKEVHLSLSKEGVEEWHKLLGNSEDNKWELANELKISFTQTSNSIGVDWIKLGVKDLNQAKQFLSSLNLLSLNDGQILIDKSKVFGLKFLVEEL